MAVAQAATATLCRLIILPITPPAEFDDAISTGFMCSVSAVTTCRLPNSALADVSLPVRNTPSHPSSALKNGNSDAGRGERQAQRRGGARSSSSGRPAPAPRRWSVRPAAVASRCCERHVKNRASDIRSSSGGKHRGDQARGAGRRKPVEGVDALRKAPASPRPAACAGSGCAARAMENFESLRVRAALERLVAPQQHEHHQQQVRHPRHHSSPVGMARRRGLRGSCARRALKLSFGFHNLNSSTSEPIAASERGCRSTPVR